MRRPRFVRLLAVGLALVTLGACKPLDDAMVFVFGRSMRDSRSFDPYENTRPAPPNAYAFATGDYLSRDADAERSPAIPRFTQANLGVPGVGDEIIQGLVNPLAPEDPAALARGEELYMRFCVVCHGPDGVGANAYIAAKHPVLPAYNLSGPQVAAYSDQYIYAMIRVGRGLMPEYGSRTSSYDRWAVVNYVRTLQAQAGN